MTRPDIEAIAARCKERQELARSCGLDPIWAYDAMALFAYIAELEADRDGIKARAQSVIRARDHDLLVMRDAYSIAVAKIADLEADLALAQAGHANAH